MIYCDSFALPDMGARVEYSEVPFPTARYYRVLGARQVPGGFRVG